MKKGLDEKKVRVLIKSALREDLGDGDFTTDLSVSPNLKLKGDFICKEDAVIAGLVLLKPIFNALHSDVKVTSNICDGEKVCARTVIASITGNARAILKGERLALNFLQRLSGIATVTNRFVEKVSGYKAKIFDTRKTTPSLRRLEKYAVRMGGGTNHRFDLSKQILIKDNHLQLVREKSIADLIARMRKDAPKGMKIEVEVEKFEELEQVLEAKPDIIMLDNMTPAKMRICLKFIERVCKERRMRRPLVEASGNVNLRRVEGIAKTGVDRISVGTLTHSVKAIDISLEVLK